MAHTLATTKMSSRGQVVIPQGVRTDMGLKDGVEFVVLSQGDVVMLKVISPPSLEEYPDLMKRLRRHAREAGLRQRDVAQAIHRVRGRR